MTKVDNNGLLEVVADIAFNAGNMMAKNQIEVSNSRKLMLDIICWAKTFQDVFVQEFHADDYMELVDDYSTFCLLGEDEKAKKFILSMLDCLTNRQGMPPMELKWMPGPTDEARLLQQQQCIAYDRMYGAMNYESKPGTNDYGPKTEIAKAAYEETVSALVALLGEDAHCSEVDTDLFSAYSDFYKSDAGFRPRHHATRADVKNYFNKLPKAANLVEPSNAYHCRKCGYAHGPDWIDDGETCPKCMLVQ